MRAERRAACRRLPFNAFAGGVTPCIWGETRGFSPERGKRTAASFTQELGGHLHTYPTCSVTAVTIRAATTSAGSPRRSKTCASRKSGGTSADSMSTGTNIVA